MKDLKIVIELDSVDDSVEKSIPDALNEALSGLYIKSMKGSGGLQPFKETWTVDVTAKRKMQFAVDEIPQGNLFEDGE